MTSTADESSLGVFEINEGETETFTLYVIVDPATVGQYRVQLVEIKYSTNPNGITDIQNFAFTPPSDFRTDYLTINE